MVVSCRWICWIFLLFPWPLWRKTCFGAFLYFSTLLTGLQHWANPDSSSSLPWVPKRCSQQGGWVYWNILLLLLMDVKGNFCFSWCFFFENVYQYFPWFSVALQSPLIYAISDLSLNWFEGNFISKTFPLVKSFLYRVTLRLTPHLE